MWARLPSDVVFLALALLGECVSWNNNNSACSSIRFTQYHSNLENFARRYNIWFCNFVIECVYEGSGYGL